MALRRKPQSKSKQSPVADEEEGGGKPQLVQLRLPRALVQRIDKTRKYRLVAPSRHAWLLEALIEKLETEEHQKAS